MLHWLRTGWQSAISQGKISWNTPPWLGTEPGPRGGQTVSYSTELSWLTSAATGNVSSSKNKKMLLTRSGFESHGQNVIIHRGNTFHFVSYVENITNQTGLGLPRCFNLILYYYFYSVSSLKQIITNLEILITFSFSLECGLSCYNAAARVRFLLFISPVIDHWVKPFHWLSQAFLWLNTFQIKVLTDRRVLFF